MLGGQYRICFTNQMKPQIASADGLLLTIKFADEVVQLAKDPTNTTLAKDEHLQQLGMFAEALQRRTKDIEKYQSFEIVREGEFKDKIAQANSITQWCAIIQLIVFVGLGSWQIYTLRNYFIKRGF